MLNPWFTREALQKALRGISCMLEEEVLRQWLLPYELKVISAESRHTVGLVLAGNIPLVGFHDLLSVLASGHRVLAKTSSKDDRLIKKVGRSPGCISIRIWENIKFTDDRLFQVWMQ